MDMKLPLSRRGRLLLVLALSACVETRVTQVEEYSEDLPPAVGAPASFVDAAGMNAVTRDIGECPRELTDRKGTIRLRLLESRRTSRRHGDTTFIRGYGDYRVEPAGSYGLSPGEALRVDCARNTPVGRTTD